MAIWKLICPTKLRLLRKHLKSAGTTAVLDIGCGNHSPVVTRHWLPNVTYTGVDVTEYNIDKADKEAMDQFVLVGADGAGYDALEDGAYDVVIMNHVVEHMRHPAPVIAAACRKLRPGGYIYLAFPSVRSLDLPSGEGCLNFCDDPTHVRIPDVREVAQVLLDNGVRIIRAGRSSDPIRYLIGAVLYPLRLLQRATTGRIDGQGLWHFLGFEDSVFGQLR
jgi:SAM-dependent methyltransferase